MLYTKLINPGNTGRSYSWFPGGLYLGPGESRTIDYDPFTAVRLRKRHLEPQLMLDLKEGRIIFEYRAEAPCVCVVTETPKEAKVAPTTPTPTRKPKGFFDKVADSDTQDDLQVAAPVARPKQVEETDEQDEAIFEVAKAPAPAPLIKAVETDTVEVEAEAEEEVVVTPPVKRRTRKKKTN